MEYRKLPRGNDNEKFSVLGLVNKYYDLALAGDEIAANHYTKLSVNSDSCALRSLREPMPLLSKAREQNEGDSKLFYSLAATPFKR